MERTREGLFYARSFVDFGPFALISQNTDRYWRKLPGQTWLEHLLINSVVTQDAWEAQVEQSTLVGRGPHTLRWSLAEPSSAEAVRQPPHTRPVRRAAGVPAVAARVSVTPASVRLTALYRDGDRWTARLVQLGDVAVEAQIASPLGDAAVALAPWEIKTVFLGGPA
jgi:hypothetical protein